MTSPSVSNPSPGKLSYHELKRTSQADSRAPPENNDNDLSRFGPAPDGGTRAWLNAAGGFCIFFGCLGFTSCFGVLQEYYTTHQLRDHTADEVAWIGSLSSFIQFAGGAIGGPMFDRYGVWVSHIYLHIVLESRMKC